VSDKLDTVLEKLTADELRELVLHVSFKAIDHAKEMASEMNPKVLEVALEDGSYLALVQSSFDELRERTIFDWLRERGRI